MLDLAKVDDAFINARYSAEQDKNTDYNFLYRFVLALRHCSKKEFMMSSFLMNQLNLELVKDNILILENEYLNSKNNILIKVY